MPATLLGSIGMVHQVPEMHRIYTDIPCVGLGLIDFKVS